MQIGTVVNWPDSVIELSVDGTGVLRVQVETLVPDAILGRCLSDALATHGGRVTVVAGLALVHLPAPLLLDRPTLRALVDESAYQAEAEFRLVLDDGTGRGDRILMNLILLKRRYPAAVIQREHRRRYIEALGQADDGQLAPFVAFIANALNTTQQMMLDSLRI